MFFRLSARWMEAKDSCCETTFSLDPCCDFNTAETRIDGLKTNPAN